jgi:Ca2+-binding RTX toxin-like protein
VVRAEAVTDERGNLVFGVSAPGPGVAEISAWVDGEPWLDDDVPAADEAGATAVAAWFASSNDVGLGFIDPSPYGAIGSPGTGAGNQIPQDGEVSVTIRADVPDLAQGMELLVSSDGGQTFAPLGAPERLGSGDLFLFDWKVDLPRGTHILRAALPGTEVASDMNVTVGPPAQVVELSNKPLETVALSSPSQGGRAMFVDGVTALEGTAGPGAEGVDLFYTTHSGRTSPEAADWVFCGYVDLDGTTGAPQDFAGECALQPADRPSFVTGVAAIAVDCTLMDGCDPAPGSAGIQGRGATKASGDAVGVWGSDDATTVGFIGRRKVPAGTCRAVPVAVTDVTGEPVTNEAVSVRVEGAGIRWCGGNHAAKGGGARTFVPSADGVALPRLVASMSGATRVIAWIDRDGDGAIDDTEPSADRFLNWYAPHGCSIVGTPGDDFLYGTPGSDRICGLGGDDVIYGRAGDDHLFGGSGDDELHGGMGRDRLVGGPGSDHLFGGSDDELDGGPGEDHPENP